MQIAAPRPTFATPSQPIAADPLEAGRQAAYPRLQRIVPALGRASQELATAASQDRLDTKAVSMVALMADRAGNDLMLLSSGRPELSGPRRELARGMATGVVEALATFPAVWTLPTSVMKEVVNVHRGAERLAETLKQPDVNLIMSTDSWGLNQANHALMLISREVGFLQHPVEGRGFRVTGLARAANDAVLRIEDGLRAGTKALPFRAGKQADTATMLLRDVLRDGGDLLPAPIAAALQGAVAASTGTFSRDGRDFPAGTDAYVTRLGTLRDAAAASQAALDALAAPFLALPGAEGERFRAWRAAPEVRNGYYNDPDIGN